MMGKMKMRKWVPSIVSAMQIIIIYICDYYFTRGVHEVADSVELSLSDSEIAIGQVNAIRLAIISLGSNTASFVLGVGVVLILLNIVIFTSLADRKDET